MHPLWFRRLFRIARGRERQSEGGGGEEEFQEEPSAVVNNDVGCIARTRYCEYTGWVFFSFVGVQNGRMIESARLAIHKERETRGRLFKSAERTQFLAMRVHTCCEDIRMNRMKL